ncbi:MAG: SAF domain-containing protein [Ilumatobacteraceae bacterium]
MSPLATAGVIVRRHVARRPWLYWLVVAAAALGVAASVLQHVDRLDAARSAWGETTTVWTATQALAPGQPVVAEATEMPVAIAPPHHLTSIDGLTMRQSVGAGEVIADSDVVVGEGPLALTPTGWLAVPIVESPTSGAAIGDRVHIASDGFVITTDALVVGFHDDVTVIAVPAADAPFVPPAAAAGTLTLLRVP